MGDLRDVRVPAPAPDRSRSCDLDHVEAHADGGPTRPRNLAPVPTTPPVEDHQQGVLPMLAPGAYHSTLPVRTYLVDPAHHRLTGSTTPTRTK